MEHKQETRTKAAQMIKTSRRMDSNLLNIKEYINYDTNKLYDSQSSSKVNLDKKKDFNIGKTIILSLIWHLV